MPKRLLILSACFLPLIAFRPSPAQDGAPSSDPTGPIWPNELVNWAPYSGNPLFSGSGGDTWDRRIRERGFVLHTGGRWQLWYTGYNEARTVTRFLGYATSPDGIHWQRHPENPVFAERWVEDVFVLRHAGRYLMFAEGRNDVAHQLVSRDGIRWESLGSLDIRQVSGEPISPGPYGTPTVWLEDGVWHLFYERGDRGVWLATSDDRKVWTNVQEDPVLARGPEAYDRHAVALNQVFRYGGRYYGVYHANADPRWKGPWTTCLAVSDDLVHWEKYPRNPIIRSNDSSGILLRTGDRIRLYTMHPEVKLWLPRR